VQGAAKPTAVSRAIWVLLALAFLGAFVALRTQFPEKSEALSFLWGAILFPVGLLPGMVRITRDSSKTLAYKWTVWAGYLLLSLLMLVPFLLALGASLGS
jgi:hypothetical protein